MTILDERPADGVDEDELLVGRRIQRFSQLAGPVTDPGPGPYRVSYRGVDAEHGRGRVVRSLIVAVLNFAFEIGFFVWLLYPTHRPPVDENSTFVVAANAIVISSIALMELLRVINVFSLSLASVISRDPVPVTPEAGGRVAFLTTIVPSKEPIEVVRGTLAAALQIQYEGLLDVWILDEGDDDEVKAMCAELGVHHFTRKGIEQYNQRKGAYKAKTKHGNYNAWVAEHGDAYDVFLSVDPDHVPLPNYADRILGYFRDPDVAYVVGPQCYANDETFVTRAAESQQFPFHSLIQRAANRYDAAMLVGTNNAVRISALREVGGLSDSITEDMATGLKFHSRRNPASGARWKSVYTPDVLAVGEGPSSWGDFFSQQMRWSRGTFEVLLTEFWKRLPRLSPGRALHYVLITTFYPSMAIGWILGAVNAVLFLALGVQGIVVPVQLWLALYIDATAFQLWVYLRNRRYNVSPYEAEGSSGIKGMLMSIYASPIFAASLIATVLRLPAKFVVTPKGVSTSADHILTFRRHLQWATLLVAAIATSIALGYASPAVLLWPMVALLACLAPPALWIVERVVGRRPAITPEPVPGDGRSSLTTEALQRAALDALIAQGAVAPRRTEEDAREVPLVLGTARPGPAARPLPNAARVAAPPTVGPAAGPAAAAPSPVRPLVRPGPPPGPRPAHPAPPGPTAPPVAPAAATTPVPPRAAPPGTPPGPPPGTPAAFGGPAPAGPGAGRARPVPPGTRPPAEPPIRPASSVPPARPKRRAVVLRTRDAVAGPPPAGTPAAPGTVEPVAADGRGLNPVTGLPAAAATPSSGATRPVGSSPGRPVTPVSPGSRTGNERTTGSDGPGADRATGARSSGLNASTVAVRVVALAAVARSASAGGPGPGRGGGRTETS